MSPSTLLIAKTTEDAQALGNLIDGLSDIQIFVVPSMHDQINGV
jgi:hypothetical protein